MSSRRVIVNSSSSGSLNDRFTQMKKVGLSPQRKTSRGGSTTVTINNGSAPRGGSFAPRGGRGGQVSTRGGRGGFTSSRGGSSGGRGGRGGYRPSRGGRGGFRGGRGGNRGGKREKTPSKEELDQELDEISNSNSMKE
ncbi:hypothetical protein RB653_006060 [Dictyostelium firmibasis]|uniref:Chromatin target of PRMT1 protein C-terminal domain-containing protein n=1 Tax=Dictyostelium firmibasis TaxID=79012 RepID=A0AAN7YTH1_9MYCE